MNALEQIQNHAVKLPTELQMELLRFTLYLEYKAQQMHSIAPDTNDKTQLSSALEAAVALNPFADIIDPVAWQREQREDRKLFELNELC